jgi:uncharacterized protein
MNRRQWIMLSGATAALQPGWSPVRGAAKPGSDESVGTAPDKLLLKDYRPRSIYKVPITEVKKARFPVIDVHSHAEWVRSPEHLEEIVKLMDAAGVERTVMFVRTGSPEKFAAARGVFAKHPDRFDLWCGFELGGHKEPGFAAKAVRALEDCRRLGALGVGEIGDKGEGIWSSGKGSGLHVDDDRMSPLYDKCAQLGMPINIHVSDPIWSYESMDNTNDGLMNCYTWRITVKPGVLGHDELIGTLERAVHRHPKTTFIACHIANLEYDLARLGGILDRNPNLSVDLGARCGELSPIPRAAARFFGKYPDRVLYGTDMGYHQLILSATFRILETADEHFYVRDAIVHATTGGFDYHWPLYGLDLPDDILRKVYADNARRIFQQARDNAA